MKFRYLFFLLLLLGGSYLKAQDTVRSSFEIGTELLRLNELWSSEAPDLNPIQVFPGLVFRYAPAAWGQWKLRAGMNYNRNQTQNDWKNCNDCGRVNQQGWNIGARLGAQFTLPKHRDWVYALADVYLYHYQGAGLYVNHAWGYQRITFQRKFTGLQLQLGMGLQLRIWKRLYIGQEWTLGFGRQHTFHHNDASPDAAASTRNSTSTIRFQPMGKLFFSVKI